MSILNLISDWLYQQCKLIDGLPAGTQGTTFRAMLSVLKNVGCMQKGGNPNDSATIAKYKIKGYVQVSTDIQSLKTAIYNFGVVLIGFHGSDNGWQTAVIRAPLPGETIWGHATSGKGYNEINVRGQNSWGQQWGDNGDFYFGQEYTPFEAWAVVQTLPANWESLLPQQNDKPHIKFVNPLSYGVRGSEVIQLQDCLKWIGCIPNEVPSTGLFGPLTLAGVKLFQERCNLPQTGYVGQLTINQLNQIFAQ